MGEKTMEQLDPNWRFAGKLLSVEVVCAITGFSYDTVLRLRRTGMLVASLDRKPYHFDPEHIYQVFFGARKIVVPHSVSSLKTEKSDFISRKPVKKEDLWQ